MRGRSAPDLADLVLDDVMVVAQPVFGPEAASVGRAGKQRIGLFEGLGAAGQTAEQRARLPRAGPVSPVGLAQSPAMRHHLRGALQFGDNRGKLVVLGTLRSRYPAWPCECAAGEVALDCVISTRRAVQADLSGGALQCCWATSDRGSSAEAGVTGRGSPAVGSDRERLQRRRGKCPSTRFIAAVAAPDPQPVRLDHHGKLVCKYAAPPAIQGGAPGWLGRWGRWWI